MEQAAKPVALFYRAILCHVKGNILAVPLCLNDVDGLAFVRRRADVPNALRIPLSLDCALNGRDASVMCVENSRMGVPGSNVDPRLVIATAIRLLSGAMK